jgi:hypothetical protein
MGPAGAASSLFESSSLRELTLRVLLSSIAASSKPAGYASSLYEACSHARYANSNFELIDGFQAYVARKQESVTRSSAATARDMAGGTLLYFTSMSLTEISK